MCSVLCTHISYFVVQSTWFLAQKDLLFLAFGLSSTINSRRKGLGQLDHDFFFLYLCVLLLSLCSPEEFPDDLAVVGGISLAIAAAVFCLAVTRREDAAVVLYGVS